MLHVSLSLQGIRRLNFPWYPLNYITAQTKRLPWPRTESRHRFAVDLLNCLDKLPVDYAALMGGIGKTVSKLKKHEQGAVKQLADGLVKKWKAVAAAGKPKDTSTSASGKRDRCLSDASSSQDREKCIRSGDLRVTRVLTLGTGIGGGWGLASEGCHSHGAITSLSVMASRHPFSMPTSSPRKPPTELVSMF